VVVRTLTGQYGPLAPTSDYLIYYARLCSLELSGVM
jgi:hypothetical protein